MSDDRTLFRPLVRWKLFAAYGCNSKYYDSNYQWTGIHLFPFPQKNLEKSVRCNMIKRQDRRDGFHVTNFSFLCDKHFAAEGIKKPVNRWKLHTNTEPSLNLFNISADKPLSKKPPTPRNSAEKPLARKKLNMTKLS